MAKRLIFTLCVVSLVVSAGASSGIVPSARPLDTPVTDDSVNAIARSGSTIYVGGYFSHVAPRTGSFVVISATKGTPDSSYPELSGFASLGEGVNSPVMSIVDDGSGGWFVGGSFRFAGGMECLRLAHIRANKTVDRAFCAEPNGPVLALARAGSRLYIAGRFTTIGGKPRANLAALDLRTGALTNWRADVTGKPWTNGHDVVEPNVDALAVNGSTVYVGGFFDKVRGLPRSSVAAIDASTGLVKAWNVRVGKAPAQVLAVALSGRTVYVGGSFEAVGGKRRSGAAAMDAVSGRVAAWNPSPNGTVRRIAASGTRVYTAGEFTSIGSARRNGLAALDPQSGRAASWDPAPQGAVDAIALTDQEVVYVSGGFKRIGGASRRGLAALDPGGRATSWRAPAPNFDSCCFTIPALASAGGRVAAGGHFGSMGGLTREGLAAIESRTGRPTAWKPAGSAVGALALSGSTLYAGGDGGVEAIDIDTGGLGWTRHPNSVTQTTTAGSVDAVATDGATVYVGGYFVRIGGKPRPSLAAIDARTGRITPWHPSVSGSLLGGLGEVTALVVAGRTLYVGGEFDAVDGKPRANFAAFDTKTGDVLALNPGTNAKPYGVKALAVTRSTLYVGGDFTNIGGQPRRGVAAIDIRTGAVTPWNLRLTGTDVEVDAIATSDSTVFVGGVFSEASGRPRSNLAAVRLDSGRPLPWAPRVGEQSPDFGVRALALGPSALFVGGGFESVGGFEQRYLAAFRLRG